MAEDRDKRIDRAVAMHQAGYSISQIAGVFGVGDSCVVSWLFDWGVREHRRGTTIGEIADALRMAPGVVRYRLRDRGVRYYEMRERATPSE
jgi:hypothetical protein